MRACLILLMSACTVTVLATGNAFAKEPPVFDPAAEPAALAAAFLKVDKPKALAGISTVAISNFRVEFAVENNGKAQSSGTQGATSVKADILLQGIDDPTRQAIADQLYDGFVADLTAAGIQVVPYETLAANAEYQTLAPRFKKSYEPVGTQLGKSVFVGPHAMPVYFTNDDRHLGLGAAFGSLNTTQPQNIEPAIARSLNAAILRVGMNIQFAAQKSSGGMFRSGSSIESDTRLAFFPETTQILVVSPAAGKSRITLEHPVALQGEIMKLEDAMAGSEKAANAVGNVITGLTTGITRQVKRYNATATPDAYAAGINRYGAAFCKAVAATIGGQANG
jgi:hypothetical protein